MPGRNHTASGMVALAFWATSIAFTRALSEALGPVVLVAVSFGAGGLLALGLEWWRYGRIRALAPPSWPYLIWAGFFFVCYTAGYVPALAMAADRQVVLQLTIVNYLWPGLIVLGSVFFLQYRARWYLLLPGLAVAFLGVTVCIAGEVSFGRLVAAAGGNAAAFALMAGSAACWAVYSNLARKYAPANGASGVPLFQLAAGILFILYAVFAGAQPVWSDGIFPPLAYYTVFVITLSYLLWDLAMQKGNIVLLGVLSYFLPLISTLFAGWYLREPVSRSVLAGAALVMLGAVLSRYGVAARRPVKPG